jgi:hypothetical protein
LGRVQITQLRISSIVDSEKKIVPDDVNVLLLFFKFEYVIGDIIILYRLSSNEILPRQLETRGSKEQLRYVNILKQSF